MITRRRFLGLSVALAASATARSSRVSGQTVMRLAVMVAKSSPLVELSIHDLKRLFLGDYISGPGGKRLVPLTPLASSAEHVTFDRAVLGMTPEQAGNYWIDRKIRGQSGSPKTVDSPDLMQRVLARLEGAVGYVREGPIGPDIRIVRIDGKPSGDTATPVEFVQ